MKDSNFNQKRFNILVTIFAVVMMLFSLQEAYASVERLGVAESKGMFFPDTIETIVFDDPTIEGVSCYTTRYNRALRLVDSTNSSIACRQTGKIRGTMSNRNDIFSQEKGFIFSKETVVDRYYDKKRRVLVYLSYTKSMGEGKNSSHSISVVPILPWNPEVN